MRIGLNLLYRARGAGGGVETYVQRLIDGLIRVDTRNEYVLFVSETAEVFSIPDRGNMKIVPCKVDSSNRVIRYLWEQAVLPTKVRAHNVQLLHSMNYVSPLLCQCRTVVTFQDVSYRDSNVEMSLSRRIGLGLFSTLSAKSTDVVVTVSEFSKKSICSSLRVPREKVRVVPSGPGWNSERPSCSDIERTLRKYRIAGPYLAAFAGGYPHKNIPRLLAAFQSACRDLPHELVLIGRLPPNVEVEFPLVKREFKERIRLLGYIPSSDIYPILSGSEMFVFPSLYEGFGFPILEAQAAGAAVACSNIASLPEVAGNGAVYFDPLSVDNISQTLRRHLECVTLRNRLVELGTENVRRFSWVETAKAYVRLYDEFSAGSRVTCH